MGGFAKASSQYYSHDIWRGREWNEICDHKGIIDVFISYFTRLFSTSNSGLVDYVVGCCNNKLSEDQIIFLNASYIEEEVKVAVKEMGADKASGPDGVNVDFYHKN